MSLNVPTTRSREVRAFPPAVRSPRRPQNAEARNETRTRDPFLTMEVLYQLSYPGARINFSGAGRIGARRFTATRLGGPMDSDRRLKH